MKLLKSITVKHERVSNLSPEVQNQVLEPYSRSHLTGVLILTSVRLFSSLHVSYLSGVTERFGDIRPDGESYFPHWRDHRRIVQDPKWGWTFTSKPLSYCHVWFYLTNKNIKIMNKRVSYILSKLFNCLIHLKLAKLNNLCWHYVQAHLLPAIFVNAMLEHLLRFTACVWASPTQDSFQRCEPEPETSGTGYCPHVVYWWPTDTWVFIYVKASQEYDRISLIHYTKLAFVHCCYFYLCDGQHSFDNLSIVSHRQDLETATEESETDKITPLVIKHVQVF